MLSWLLWRSQSRASIPEDEGLEHPCILSQAGQTPLEPQCGERVGDSSRGLPLAEVTAVLELLYSRIWGSPLMPCIAGDAVGVQQCPVEWELFALPSRALCTQTGHRAPMNPADVLLQSEQNPSKLPPVT